MTIHYDIREGDRVIWRRDGDEWTVYQIREGHYRPVVLRHRAGGGYGPIEIGRANPSELLIIRDSWRRRNQSGESVHRSGKANAKGKATGKGPKPYA